MDLLNRKNLLIRRSHQTAVCTFTDADRNEPVAEVFILNKKGIHYLRQPLMGSLPESATLYYEAYRCGLYSQRPYHLQCGSDASLFYSVLALGVSCCKAWNLDAIGLIRAADPHASVYPADLLEIKDFAKWQNTVFPGTWNTSTIEALSQALEDVECSALASLIKQRTVETRGY